MQKAPREGCATSTTKARLIEVGLRPTTRRSGGPRQLLLLQPGDDVWLLIGPGEVEGDFDAVAFFRIAPPSEAELTVLSERHV
jgi:hypothetical protein